MSNEKQEQKEVITPSQYFERLKGAKNEITSEDLKESINAFVILANKYEKTGQSLATDKLIYLSEVMKKEEQLISMGINTFIYKDVIEDYITKVADKTVKIVELSRYMRELPDEIVETVAKVKDIFDELYVVFTDYTGKEERKVEKERRDKDPILFGVFKNNAVVADRFYFLGDWVDEYCDLTLDKLIDQYKDKKGYSPLITTSIPKNVDELVDLMKTYKVDEKKPKVVVSGNNFITSAEIPTFGVDPQVKPRKSFFDKIRSILKK
jgi:phosphate uptake regulator